MTNRWIRQNVSRRHAVGVFGMAAAASVLPRVPGLLPVQEPEAPKAGTPAPPGGPACVVRPQQTEGPYFVDERLQRSDIRTDPADGSIVEGAPLEIEFRVSRIEGSACTAVGGAVVDLWQCDARGFYSDVEDFQGLFDTRGKKFLRGCQLSDREGVARFLTIYPGWYPGRAVHVHFKIRTEPEAGRGLEFTSQLYFDDAFTDEVHARPPYAREGRRRRNEDDGIFRRGGSRLILPVRRDGERSTGIFDIGLKTA